MAVASPSRQPPPAPQPYMLLGLELGERQQIAQMNEPVAQREPGQICCGLGDEACRLVRAALAWQLVDG